MQRTKTKPFVDEEVLALARRGLVDETIPAVSGTYWISRVGRTLIALKSEHARRPEIIFCHEVGSSEEVKDALDYLKQAAKNQREATDSTERIRREAAYSIRDSLEGPCD